MAVKLKRSTLATAAAELNETLGLSPAIDVAGTLDEMKEKLTTAMGLLAPTDKITPATQEILDALKEEIDEAAPPVNIYEVLVAAKKLQDLKAIALKHPQFEKLRPTLDKYQGLSGPRELKPLMMACLPADMIPVPTEKPKAGPADPNAPKRPKVAKGEKGEKMKAMEQLISEGVHTRKVILEKMHALFPAIAPSTFGTILTDAKNAKYNKFDSLVMVKDGGVLTFA